MYYVWLILEGIIKYACLGLIISMGILLFVMILLFERDRVRGLLRLPLLVEKFEDLCALSDRLDTSYLRENPYGNALWVKALIFKVAICAGGLMVIWIILSALKS